MGNLILPQHEQNHIPSVTLFPRSDQNHKVNRKHLHNHNNVINIALFVKSAEWWYQVTAWKDFLLHNGCTFICSTTPEKPNVQRRRFPVRETKIMLKSVLMLKLVKFVFKGLFKLVSSLISGNSDIRWVCMWAADNVYFALGAKQTEAIAAELLCFFLFLCFGLSEDRMSAQFRSVHVIIYAVERNQSSHWMTEESSSRT